MNYSTLLQSRAILFTLAALIATPILLLQISSDQAIFLRAGETILEGKKLYVDFIDIKPPLFFYVFAGIQWFCSNTNITSMFLNYLIVITTVLIIMYRKKSIDMYDWIWVLSYTVLYTSLSMNVLYPEMLCMPLLLYVSIQASSESPTRMSVLFSGVVVGICAALKYTPAIMILLSPTVWFFTKVKNFRILLMLHILGAILAFVLCHFPLLDTELREGYFRTLTYIQAYSNHDLDFTLLLRIAIDSLNDIFSKNYTIISFSACLLGIRFILLKSSDIAPNDRLPISMLVSSVLLYLSVVAERKFLNYHYIRLLPEFCFITVFGYYGMYKYVKSISIGKQTYRWAIIAVIVMIMIILSPVKPYIKNVMLFQHISSPVLREALFTKQEQFLQSILSEDSASQYLKTLTTRGAKKFLIQSVGGITLSYKANIPLWSVFGQSQFYYSDGIPKEWYNQYLEKLYECEVLVVDNCDRYPGVNGHNLTSFESLQKDISSFNYVESTMTRVCEYGRFGVYIRNNLLEKYR